jgi:hypothetical protein
VAAFVRRCFIDGAHAVVEKKGAEEAGAIFIVVDRLDRTLDLYGPAPQAALGDTATADRQFQKIIAAGAGDAITTRLASERRFDPDLWIVAVEVRSGQVPLEVVAGDT